MIGQSGVYWPFKTLLQGAGISIQEDAVSIRITATGGGGGPGGGDMLSTEYATNGVFGVVDRAVLANGLAPGVTVPQANLANSVPWQGVTGAPTSFPSDWSIITNRPNAFPPTPHAPTHAPTGTDPISLATVTAPGFLTQLSGNTTDFVDGTNACQPLSAAVAAVSPPAIWAVRLRSYNAVGNPNFEVIQRNVGTAISLTAMAGQWIEDRWVGVLPVTGTVQAAAATDGIGGGILLPGTNFAISKRFMRTTLSTTKTVLAASDWGGFYTQVEGPVAREMMSDFHSLSLLCRSSIPNLSFAISIRDSPATRSLVLPVTLGPANTLTLITLPALSWPTSGGNFSTANGVVGYLISIVLAAGSNYWIPSGTQNTWQNGNFLGFSGMGNFAFGPVGATFDLCFLQHEPGSVCTTFIDKPFQQNVNECRRYYQKSGPYGQRFPNGNWEVIGMAVPNLALVRGLLRFSPRMCRAPTMSFCDQSARVGLIYIEGTGQFLSSTGTTATDNTLMNINTNANITATGEGQQVLAGWVADCAM